MKIPSKLTRLTALAVMTAALGVSACNTIQGAGTDIKKTGQTIEKAADKTKPR